MQEDEIYVYLVGNGAHEQDKRRLSREVEQQVQEYLAKGGKITVADQGEVGLEKSHHSFDRRFLVK